MCPIQETPPQPIKNIKHKTNIWLILIPIIFIAIVFMLYVFAWEEAKNSQQIQHIAMQSKTAINDVTKNSQQKINVLQAEIGDLKKQVENNIFMPPCEDGFMSDNRTECMEVKIKYYCEVDSDCVIQDSCNTCSCPVVINKDNLTDFACPHVEELFPSECDLYCELTVPKCVDGYCELVAE